MATQTKAAKINSQTGIRWMPEDVKLLTQLHKKLGVGVVQLVRLGLRALAAKEGVA